MTTHLNRSLTLHRIQNFEEQIARCKSDVDKVLLLVVALHGRADQNVWGFDGADVCIESGNLPEGHGQYSAFIHDQMRALREIKKMVAEGDREAA